MLFRSREVVDALRGLSPIAPTVPIPFDPAESWNNAPDLADVMGQPLYIVTFATY